MRKIISVSVALSLMLTMAVAAVPAAAVSWVEVVDIDEPLAGEEAEYTILFHNNAMLEGWVDFIDVLFPPGSDVATVVDDPVVLVGPTDDELVPVAVANWAAVGTRTLRIYPEADINKSYLVKIIIDGVTNPGASHYRLQVGTSTHTPVASEVYTIYALVRMQLDEGKNLISLPYYPEDEAIEVVLKDLLDEADDNPAFEFSVWYWDAVARQWLVYESDMSSTQIDKIEPSKAYWIKVSDDIGFYFRGVPYPACNCPPVKWYYVEGWNMVGFASQTPMAAEEYLRNARQSWPKQHNLAVLYIFGWGAAGWETMAWTDDLTPGRGYFMAFLTDAYIIPPIPETTATAHAEETSSDTNAFAMSAAHDVTQPTSLAAEIHEIRDWYDLDAIRDNLGDTYLLMNDLDSTTPGYVELASPTADEGKGWPPIGTADDRFTGTLDGQDYEIEDLFINRPHEDHVGLFGVVAAEAVIQNVGLVDVDVTGDYVVGGLAGWNWGTLTNCYATGTVAGTGPWGFGGLAGVLVGSNAGTIGDSYATGNVTGSSDVGGLVGSNVGAISSSYSTGSVTGEEGVGGLVGSNALSGVVINSYSTGSVIGEENVGGLVGWNYCATVSQSYSTGTVTGHASVGGLVGASVTLFSQWGTVSDSFWDTETSGIADSAGGTGRATAEMQDFATFTDTATEGLDEPWDIVAVAPGVTFPAYTWNIVDGQTYPFLGWELDNGAPVVSSMTETITDDTLDAKDEADTEVLVTGNATVTVALFADNPGGDPPAGFGSLGKYIDVYVPDTTDVTEVEIRLYYTSDELAAADLNEALLRLMWWDGYYWLECSDSGVNTAGSNGYSGYIWARITADSSPNLAQLAGTPFGGYSVRAIHELQTWYDLHAIRDNLSGHYVLMNDLDSTSPGYGELAGPAADDGKGWEPIGTEDAPFIGKFDGQGYEIRDMFMNRPDEDRVGLFGCLGGGGAIQDIGVVSGVVTGRDDVGGLVGANYGGTVSNSYSTSSVTDGRWRVGGLVGDNYEGTVTNSYSMGSVSGDHVVGGLIGHSYEGVVTDSCSAGNVTGDSTVGGLVGITYWGTLSDSHSSTDVVGNSCPVGGLVGENRGGTVSNSFYNYEEVFINGEHLVTIGALFAADFEQWLANDKFLDVDERLGQDDGYFVVDDVGDFRQLLPFGQDGSLKFRLKNDLDLANDPNLYIPYLGGEFDGNGHRISNLSFNSPLVSQVGLFGYLACGGHVTHVAVESASVVGGYSIGGLVGDSRGTVTNSSSTGSIAGAWSIGGLVGANYGTVSRSSSTADVNGVGNVGGLVGTSFGIVSSSSAIGVVSGDARVGGLLGYNAGGIVSNCYATGSVAGEESVGGLIGWNRSNTVHNSYSSGSVIGMSQVGGLVGSNGGTVSNSFWDVETSGMGVSDGGTGKTTAEMQNIVTFINTETEELDEPWDIASVAHGETDTAYTWNIVDGETYPFLGWEAAALMTTHVHLKAGWNLVSVPVIPADTSVASVFAGTEVVYAWNATAGSYYMPTEVEPHRGYWVAVMSDTIITVSGVPIYSWTAEMTAGWNLIGSVYQAVDFSAPDTTPPGKVEPFSFRWAPTSGYTLETTIVPGMGHWVAATGDCVLTLSVQEA